MTTTPTTRPPRRPPSRRERLRAAAALRPSLLWRARAHATKSPAISSRMQSAFPPVVALDHTARTLHHQTQPTLRCASTPEAQSRCAFLWQSALMQLLQRRRKTALAAALRSSTRHGRVEMHAGPTTLGVCARGHWCGGGDPPPPLNSGTSGGAPARSGSWFHADVRVRVCKLTDDAVATSVGRCCHRVARAVGAGVHPPIN